LILLHSNIDPNSRTWKEICKFADEEKAKAIKALIADSDSERQRGVLMCLEKLSRLVETQPKETITEVNYN
jgi:hypothetical protein